MELRDQILFAKSSIMILCAVICMLWLDTLESVEKN